MDVDGFLAAVPTLFADPADARGPLADPGHAEVVTQVAGMSTAHKLAVLNLAARLLPAGECYLEVGSFKGRSLVGATRGVTGRRFVAIESFTEFGMLGQQARAELHENIGRHCAGQDVELLEGDAFALLRRPGTTRGDVGVYFYDGEHTTLAHYVALGVVEPLLADEALVLVDDASWPLVGRAHERFLADHPGWSVVARWDARHNDDPLWANGLHALRFRRPPGRGRTLSAATRRALAAQRLVVGPARTAVWRTLHHAPWLTPLAKRLEPTSQHTIAH